jgi:hypothetical protein
MVLNMDINVNVGMFIIVGAILFFLFMLKLRNDEKQNLQDEEEKDKFVSEKDEELTKLYSIANSRPMINANKKKHFVGGNKSKIAIVTYDDRTNVDYIKMHDENVSAYCKKWGYTYIRTTENPKQMTPYWHKMFVVNDVLKTNKYDYVFWMDSDTVINNFNMDLGDDVLNKYDSDIFVGNDNATYDVSNAGLFIIRNTPIGNEFMDECIKLKSDKCDINGNKLRGKWAMFCYEQGIMNKLIFEKYSKYTTFLDNSILMNAYGCNPDTFIMHSYGGPSIKRAKCFERSVGVITPIDKE